MSWTCSHGCTYSNEEMDMGMSFATMDWLMEQDIRQMELDADLRREEKLSKEYVLFLEDSPHWPWYADSPIEIQDPEIIYV
jgi:hypothetical protein